MLQPAFRPNVTVIIKGFQNLICFHSTPFSNQGIQRLYKEGDDVEEVDEGVGEEAVEDEEQDEEEEDKEKDWEGDAMQTKEQLLPERRSRRLKSEVN